MVVYIRSIGKKKASLGATPAASSSAAAAESVTLRDPAVMKRIAETAYHLWEKRGRPHGNDLRDWLEAEKIVLRNTSQ